MFFLAAGPLRAAKIVAHFRQPVTGFHLINLNLWIFYKVTLIVARAVRRHSVAADGPSNLAISSGGALGSNKLFGPAKEKHEINKK
jgi:hypothetical protein